MTLETVNRYDPDNVDGTSEHHLTEFEVPALRTPADSSVRLIDEKTVSTIQRRLYQRLLIRALCARSSEE